MDCDQEPNVNIKPPEYDQVREGFEFAGPTPIVLAISIIVIVVLCVIFRDPLTRTF
jgi:hypothetical protein